MPRRPGVAVGPKRDARKSAGDFESSPIRFAIVGLVALKIVGVVLIFDPASAVAFDGPKTSFSLALTWLLLGLVLVALWRFGSREFFQTRLHLVVGTFLLANGLSALFAQDQYTALFGAQRRLGLTFVLDMVVLYLAVSFAYRTARDWIILGGAIAGAGVLAIAYGVLQYAGLDPIPWADEVRTRPPSTFGNADKFGHFLGASIVAAAGVALVPTLSNRVRVLAAVYALAALVMAVLVATRGTVLGLAVGLPVLAVIYFKVSDFRFGPRLALGIAGVLLGVAVLAGAALAATPLGERVRGGFGDVATQQRYFVANAAVRALWERPLLGHGVDNFGVIYPQYRLADSVRSGILVNQDSAHSSLLQTAATTGAIGMLSLAAVVLGSLLVLWRRIAAVPHIAVPALAGAVAYWAQGLVAIGSVSIDWIGWLAAGTAVALGRRPATAPARTVALGYQAVPLLAALTLVISGNAAFQASRDLYLARTARTPERALAPAERAVRLDPGRAEHWFALGRAREAQGSLAQAADAFRIATEQAPYVSSHWTNLAIVLANLAHKGDESLGGKEAALAAARRGIASDPSFPTPYHVSALVSNSFGDHLAALEAAASAIRLHKNEPQYDVVAADAATRLANATVARMWLDRIVREKDSAVLRVALARVSLKLNDTAAAQTHVRRALELDPQNVPAQELMRQLGVVSP